MVIVNFPHNYCSEFFSVVQKYNPQYTIDPKKLFPNLYLSSFEIKSKVIVDFLDNYRSEFFSVVQKKKRNRQKIQSTIEKLFPNLYLSFFENEDKVDFLDN